MGAQSVVSSLLDHDPKADLSLKHVLFTIGTGVGAYYVAKCLGECVLSKYSDYVRNQKERKRREKWENVEKYVVVLHQYPRSVLTPSPSPFALKFETYLRMADIPYQNDLEEPISSNGDTIRITFDGEEIVGSQLCMEFLARKFQKDFSSSMSPIEKATATAFQIMCEEHLYWVLVLWWFDYTGGDTVPLILPSISQSQIKNEMSAWKNAARNQGMGCHTEAEVIEMAIRDLRSLSLYLGTKPYFSGEQPAEADCAFFGVLAQVVWATPGSLMEKHIQKELSNLLQFCERMKEKFWSDWNQCLDRPEEH